MRPRRPAQQEWLHAPILAFARSFPSALDGSRSGGSSSASTQSTVERTIALRSARARARPFPTRRRKVARTPVPITVVRSSSRYLPFISALPWQHRMERPIGPIRDALQVRPALLPAGKVEGHRDHPGVGPLGLREAGEIVVLRPVAERIAREHGIEDVGPLRAAPLGIRLDELVERRRRVLLEPIHHLAELPRSHPGALVLLPLCRQLQLSYLSLCHLLPLLLCIARELCGRLGLAPQQLIQIELVPERLPDGGLPFHEPVAGVVVEPGCRRHLDLAFDEIPPEVRDAPEPCARAGLPIGALDQVPVPQ